MKTSFHKAFAPAAAAPPAPTPLAQAAGVFADQDLDPRFKAEIMKEKGAAWTS